MTDDRATTEEEPDVEAHGSKPDVVEGHGSLHEDDSDDVEAHMFTQGSSAGTQTDIKDGAGV